MAFLVGSESKSSGSSVAENNPVAVLGSASFLTVGLASASAKTGSWSPRERCRLQPTVRR